MGKYENLDERVKVLEEKKQYVRKKVKSLYEEYGKYLDELIGGIKDIHNK